MTGTDTFELQTVTVHYRETNRLETCYTVLHFDRGVCRGGDFHWVLKASAEAAMAAYAAGVVKHGEKDPQVVLKAARELAL